MVNSIRSEINVYRYQIKKDEIVLELDMRDGYRVLITFKKDAELADFSLIDDKHLLVEESLEKFPLIRDMLLMEKPLFFMWKQSDDDKSKLDWAIQSGNEPIGTFDEETIGETPENIYDKIKLYMDKMNLRPTWKNNRFLVQYNLENEAFIVNVFFDDKWVETGSLLVKGDSIPKDIDKEKLYARLLMDNFYAKEVTYGMTKDGDIIVHADASVEVINYENFVNEYYSVVYGIRNFIEGIVKDFPSLKNYDHKKEWNIEPV
jgi:hypothetical protein